MEEMKQNTSWGTITQANCEGFRNFSRIALQRQLTVAPTGASLPGGDNANRSAQAGIIPSVPPVHTRTNNVLGSVYL